MRARLPAVTAGVVMTLGLTAVPASAVNPALTYVPDAQWWGTNGRVVDIEPAGNRVYIAGGFDYVGPPTGYGVGTDGTGRMLNGAPLIDGPVYAAVADGQGGWYVGGDFAHVGGMFRRRVAQITASGQVTSWNPRPDGAVRALAVSGGTVFLGGDFANAGVTPVPANRLAAVSSSTGDAVPGWSASVNASVRQLVASGTSVYAAGDFTTVNGASRAGLVRLSAATGAVESAFAGRTLGAVKAAALSPDGATLYVGGDLTSAWNGSSFSSRSRLAAFGTASGALQAWAPAVNATVQALAVDPSTGDVYAGGLFSSIAGATRARLAGLTATGTVLAFDAGLNGCNVPHTTKDAHSNPTCTPEVSALSADSGTLYVGGRFGQSGATQRHDAAAFQLGNGSLAGWDPVGSNRPFTLAASGPNVFVGGELTSINGVVRKGVAALNATTGEVDPTFNADTNDMVLDMAISPDGGRLYMGGHFTLVRGLKRNRLASVLTADGTPDKAFKPHVNNDVLAVNIAANALYIGGQFKKVNQVPRSHAAKLSLTTAAVDPTFRADTVGPAGSLRANGMVQTMQVAPDGSKVYLGGPFETVNGVQRRGIAVVNGTTGVLLPNQLGGIQTCAPGNGWVTKLYLSPDGQRLYGGDLCPDWVYQWDAVNLSSPSKPNGLNWKTLCNAGMQGTLEVNGHFYYGTHGGDRGSGGYCWATPNNGPRVVQQRYFVFDQASGNLLPDAPEFNTSMGVWSFARIGRGLLAGGDFTFAGDADHPRQGLALFPGTP